MCVKMVRDSIPCPFDPSGDFLEQVKNCTEVIVNYQPDDLEVKKFLQEVQKCVKKGTNLSFDVKVDYGNYLMGFKTKKQTVSAMNDIRINDVIKLLALTQHMADRKLEELSSMCLNREMNGK